MREMGPAFRLSAFGFAMDNAGHGFLSAQAHPGRVTTSDKSYDNFYMKHLFYFTVLLCASTAFAETRTIHTLDKQIFEKAEVTRREPDGITLSYPDGIAKILFTNLSPEDQKIFGYDPAKAAAYTAMVARADAERRRAHAANLAARVAQQTTQIQLAEREKLKQTMTGTRCILQVRKVLEHGVLGHTRMEKVVPIGEDGQGIKVVTNFGKVFGERSIEPVYVYGGVEGVVEGDRMELVIYPAGTHQYTGITGDLKTVDAYAQTKDEAAIFLTTKGD